MNWAGSGEVGDAFTTNLAEPGIWYKAKHSGYHQIAKTIELFDSDVSVGESDRHQVLNNKIKMKSNESKAIKWL